MRYIKDIPHPSLKVGLYQWNSKYIIRIELGLLEQTYKIEEYEVSGVEEIEKCMDATFMAQVLGRFQAMGEDFSSTLLRNEVIF